MRDDLRHIATAKLQDAEVLCEHGRYDGAIYLYGYSIELALKARICRTLKWAGFPETNKELEDYKSFRTHKLDVLLHLSGIEAKVKPLSLASWSAIATWDPEVRYRRVGRATKSDAQRMLVSAKAILKEIR